MHDDLQGIVQTSGEHEVSRGDDHLRPTYSARPIPARSPKPKSIRGLDQTIRITTRQGEQIQAQVLDLSLKNVGVLTDHSILSTGMEVSTNFRGSNREANVLQVKQTQRGYRVGLEWI